MLLLQEPALQVQHSDLLYDFAWYPAMDSTAPETCVFATTCGRDCVRLVDAYTGATRATYRAVDHLERVSTAHSLCFSPDGTRIVAGYDSLIRIFYTANPGTDCVEVPFYGETERWRHDLRPVTSAPSLPLSSRTEDKMGQRGIFSCIAFNPQDRKMFAVGSFSKQISISREPDDYASHVLQGQRGGVTHLTFSPDGTRLFSGGRRVRVHDACSLCQHHTHSHYVARRLFALAFRR